MELTCKEMRLIVQHVNGFIEIADCVVPPDPRYHSVNSDRYIPCKVPYTDIVYFEGPCSLTIDVYVGDYVSYGNFCQRITKEQDLMTLPNNIQTEWDLSQL